MQTTPNPQASPDFNVSTPVIPPIDIRAKKELVKLGSGTYLRNKRYASDTTARNLLTIWASIIVTIWLTLALYIVCRIKLSDTVKCMLLGTTTLNVLGLMYIVLKGYFRDDQKIEIANDGT